MFGQTGGSREDFDIDPTSGESAISWIASALAPLFSLAYFAFTIWMVVECLRKDPDRVFWIWIILLLHPFGPFIYFFVRWLPGNELRLPKSLQRWTRGTEINRLETAALQIGNAHQYIQLGDALRDVGQYDKAGAAYSQALQKDAENPQALWGAALVDIEHKQFEPARQRLEKILNIDPQYKFGDVSLAYGRSLYALIRRDEAREHLEKHVKRWRHPEALYLLATIYAENGNQQQAREQLQAMLVDINSSPKAIARRFGNWKSRAQKMLRKLPPTAR